MARKNRIGWKPSDTKESLARRAQQSTSPRQQRRFHALHLLRSGHSYAEVAEESGVSERTVKRWAADYQRHWLEPEREFERRLGRRSKLTSEQESMLKTKRQNGTLPTVPSAREWVHGEYGVKFSYSGMYRLFQRLGVTNSQLRPKQNMFNREVIPPSEWRIAERKGEIPVR